MIDNFLDKEVTLLVNPNVILRCTILGITEDGLIVSPRDNHGTKTNAGESVLFLKSGVPAFVCTENIITISPYPLDEEEEGSSDDEEEI